MLRIISLLISGCFLYSASASIYFVDYVGGSDANAGTSKAAPWKRAPGMSGFAGAYTHTAGDRFIFKGGVTWVSSWPMVITQGGSSLSIKDYYGVDSTWFTGGSWTSPAFDYQHVLIPGGNYASAGTLVNGAPNITFDGLTWKNHRAPKAGSAYGAMSLSLIGHAGGILVTNCTFLDWDMAAPIVSGDDSNGTGGVQYFPQDSFFGANVVSRCYFSQAGVSVRTGVAVRQIPTVEYSEFTQLCNAYLGGGIFRNNHIHDMQPSSDPLTHCNAIEVFALTDIYNNLVHDLANEVSPCNYIPAWSSEPSGTNLVYNNVWFNVGWQTPFAFDSGQFSSAHVGVRFLNNTVEHGSAYCFLVTGRNMGAGYIDVRNNHFVTTGTAVGYNNPPNTGTVLANLVANNLTQTPAQASSDGYTPSNYYQPVNGSVPTVGAGLNLSAYFTTDRLGNTRTVPWNLGAYQFQGAGTPGSLSFSSSSYSTPESTNLIVTVSRIGGSTGTVGAHYSTADGTAVDGTDYTASSGTVSLGNGVTGTTFIVPILRNTNYTGNLTFTVSLDTPTGGATIGAPALTTVTIVDTDPPPPPTIPVLGSSFRATNMLYYEPWQLVGGNLYSPTQTGTTNDAGVAVCYSVLTNAGVNSWQLQVNGSFPNDGANSLFFQLNDTNDISDIQPFTSGFENRWINWRGSGTFDSNQFQPLKVTFTGPITNLMIFRTREAGVTLSNVSWVLQSGPPPPPQQIFFASSTYSVSDNQGSVKLVVNRANGNTGTVTVVYATSTGTAVSGTDYQDVSGILTLTNLQETATISVPILLQSVYKTNLTFSARLSAPSANAALANPSNSVVTIQSHLTQPSTQTVYFASGTIFSYDNVSPVQVPVLRSGASGVSSVGFQTVSGSALPGIDYRSTNGLLSFGSGEVTKYIYVELIPAFAIAPPKTFSVIITNPVNAILGTSNKSVVILNSVGPPPGPTGVRIFNATISNAIIR